MKKMLKIVPLGLALIFVGCGEDEKPKQEEIAQKTKEALGEPEGELGCDSPDAKEDEECSEESTSSSFILEALDKSNTSSELPQSKQIGLRDELNSLLTDMAEEKKESESNPQDDLESLVKQVGSLIEEDSTSVSEGLESLVKSYDKQKNSKSIQDELLKLVNSADNSKLKREDLEQSLLSLVGELDSNSKLKREEVEQRLLLLVGDASEKREKSLKQTKVSLESLVSGAESEGSDSAKRLASSIIKDVAEKKIKLLRTEDNFIEIQVQSGDSLSQIALKYYGNSNKHNLIYEANVERIGAKKIIYPGMKLIIPKN